MRERGGCDEFLSNKAESTRAERVAEQVRKERNQFGWLGDCGGQTTTYLSTRGAANTIPAEV
jgi:hypothetical protein